MGRDTGRGREIIKEGKLLLQLPLLHLIIVISNTISSVTQSFFAMAICLTAKAWSIPGYASHDAILEGVWAKISQQQQHKGLTKSRREYLCQCF